MRIESFDETVIREPGVRRELDLGQVGRALSRHRFWIVVPVLACFLGTALVVNVIKPRYTAETKILLENQENFFTRPDRTDRDTTLVLDDEAVQSQVQLVTSRDIARETIRALDLQGDPEFDPVAGLGPFGRLAILLGLQPDPLRASAEDRMLSAYYDRLNVYPVVKSRVLSVQFTSVDPDLAAKAANTIADRYIALQSDAKRDSARSAAESLANLIADLKVKVAAAETKAQEYRAQNGLLVGTNNTTIVSQQLGDLTTQLAQARATEADAQAKARVLREMIKANRIADVPDVANSDLIRRISEQRVTLKAQIAQQAMTLLPGHPRMKELNAQLADIDGQLRAAGEKTVRQLENDAHIAADRVENLKSALDASKRTASEAGNGEVTLRGLEQQARLLKDQLDFNTQKYQEAVARENAVSAPADARVISRAVAPELPSFPKKLPTIAIFTFAGLILSIGILVARELLSGRAFAEEEGDHFVPQPVAPQGLGELAMGLRPAILEETISDTAPDLPEDMAALLAAVRQHGRAEGAVRLLVTGADDSIPIVPMALRIARALSEDARVVLVDCGAKPDMLTTLLRAAETSPVPGLGDLLAGGSSFAEVIHRDPQSRAHLVPAGTIAEQEDSAGFAVLVDALGETYDCVVLAAPVPGPDETLRGIEGCDIAVLLLTGRQAEAEIEACRAALKLAGAPDVLTLVLDDGSEKDGRIAA